MAINLVCECCKGKGYVRMVDANCPEDPPRRDPCAFCAGKGSVTLTASEAVTYAKFNGEDDDAPSAGQSTVL